MYAKDTTRLADDPFYNSQLVGPLASLPLPAKAAILGLLKDKEDEMRAERGENDVLRQRIRGMIAENDTVVRQMQTLDRVTFLQVFIYKHQFINNESNVKVE